MRKEDLARDCSKRETPVIGEHNLNLLHGYIRHMPSLSTTAAKVLEICNSPNTSPHELNRVISLDPVITGHVLKLVNSAYCSLAEKVNSLTRAIILVGLNTVTNLALSTAVLEKLGGKDSFQALAMNDFWTHSLCVGVTAKSIAASKGIPAAKHEEFFVAGLLHDLGKIPLNKYFANAYARTLELARSEPRPLNCAENTILGIDHCVVGKMIADKWQLSGMMKDALLFHHNPAEVEGENREFVMIMALANVYANSVQVGSSGDPPPSETTKNDLIAEVGMSWKDLLALHDHVISEIEKAKVFLQVIAKG
jgi:HD-like signal output (HDOD) protein